MFVIAYKWRYLLVAFNFPFDISRIAYQHGIARGPKRKRYDGKLERRRNSLSGGFSFHLCSYLDSENQERHDHYRPSISIKKIDSKRAIKAFTSRHDPDPTDLIWEDSESGNGEAKPFRGNFLDARTLAFALFDQSYTLERLCRDLRVEHEKQRVEKHGEVNDAYIDYNRRDVLATWEVTGKLLEEFERHPITLQATKAYSPASIGKSYLRGMGVPPILERQLDLAGEHVGYAQTAFFGGRTSAHIRRTAVPVVYTDFLSMYPTVNSLLGIWRFMTARQIVIVEHCQKDVQALLAKFASKELVGQLFCPDTWKDLTGFVKLIPDGDILPSRSKYSEETHDWQVGVNYLYGDLERDLRNGGYRFHGYRRHGTRRCNSVPWRE